MHISTQGLMGAFTSIILIFKVRTAVNPSALMNDYTNINIDWVQIDSIRK